MLIPVVLAGGVGSRLWPLSRAQLPKQFFQLPSYQGSLFQETIARLSDVDHGEIVVLSNADHRFLVAEQLRQMGISESAIFLEPVGRNTAPAVAIAALKAAVTDPDALLLVLPADHVIENKSVFIETVIAGMALARENYLVTFGIVPSAPETGYGYIRRGNDIAGARGCEVAQFVEKPDLETAKAYLDSGQYLWNSGMFLLRAGQFLDELQVHAPDILEQCRRAFTFDDFAGDFHWIPEEEFAACRGESIDYAVMEKTQHAAVIPMDAGWSDLGAWDALWSTQQKNQDGNVVYGDVLVNEVANSYIHAQSRLVAAVGIENAIIVETADAVLVADRDKSQAVKAIVKQLQANEREEIDSHTLVYRPWGSYRSLAKEEGFQVKHIVVNPGASLSLQMHHHRSEHWTVIHGAATVVCGDSEFVLHPHESTYIPQGARHRLSNWGEDAVEIIEVQMGDYLGEDDIVRFDDKYGRST